MDMQTRTQIFYHTLVFIRTIGLTLCGVIFAITLISTSVDFAYSILCQFFNYDMRQSPWGLIKRLGIGLVLLASLLILITTKPVAEFILSVYFWILRKGGLA